jgi:hypothetical protein
MGAALTYARRYALFTLVGIAGEDDVDAPDLTATTEPASGTAESNASNQNARVNGAQEPIISRTLVRRKTFRAPAKKMLEPGTSAALCDQLLSELEGLTSPESATAWAHRILGAKNSLTAADARRVEDTFKSRLAALGDGVADVVEPIVAIAEPARPTLSVGLRAAQQGKEVRSSGVDKSALALPEPRRIRDKEHVRFVTKQPCLICGRQPSDAHHLRFAQLQALGRKVSDEFTVPLCRGKVGIDPSVTARALWLQTRPLPTTSDKIGIDNTISSAAVGTNDRNSEGDRPVSRRRPNYKTKPIIAAGPQ